MKVKGPLFSQSASGTISDVLTFSERKTGQQVRFQQKQKDVLTAPRAEQREKFLDAIPRWHTRDFGISEFGFSFFGVCPECFEKTARKWQMTGYNLFIRDYLLFGE